MRGTGFLGAPSSARGRLAAAFVGAVIVLQVIVPTVARAKAPQARPTARVNVAPSLPPAPAKHAASVGWHLVFGHKVG